MHVSAIPDGMQVLHRCDNRRCVNPAHLFLGTNADNVRDKVSKGRQQRLRGTANGNCKLSPYDIALILQEWECGATRKKIAALFGVTQTTVYRVIHGRRR
jgi:hypothetical protein